MLGSMKGSFEIIWKRCHVYFPVSKGTHWLKRQICQNNVIIAEIGYVLLVQHHNRLPLVVKSHHPHAVHKLQIRHQGGKNSMGQDVGRQMISY